VALAAEADGVHLGQDDMQPVVARRILGPRAIIGLTIKTAEQAEAAAALPIDYSCVGGVFGTASKNNPAPPIGLQGLAGIASRVRRATRTPVGAIAGIDASNAAAVMDAGVDGVAVISALFMAVDPRAEAQRLRRIVDEGLARRSAS
jgi:thiamine-phosphate diphosphorylase